MSDGDDADLDPQVAAEALRRMGHAQKYASEHYLGWDWPHWTGTLPQLAEHAGVALDALIALYGPTAEVTIRIPGVPLSRDQVRERLRQQE